MNTTNKLQTLAKDGTQVSCLAVNLSNHYNTIFLCLCETVEFFAFNAKFSIMAMFACKDFTAAKKKLPPMGLDMMISGSRVS